MGCSGRVKADDLRPEQKWDFISLNDFKNTSCFAPIAYGYLWISLLISVAVYGVDTFTAVNLLAFNKWSGEIQPKIDFDIGKWIFSACIMLSWLNLAYEHVRAMRVMKRGAVAESFLDNLAVRLQCIRMGKGRGYKRFLVFAELTKSKKGAEYVALFTYFSFQAWIRIILCQGPRQVINAVTLYAVFQANFEAKVDAGSTLTTFFTNIGHLAEENNQQALVLSGMIFTLIIWVFGVLSLMLAVLFYVFFLWHYIPNRDGGLTGYCERKVDKRLSKIVSEKVNKAIEEEERKRLRMDQKALKKGEQPTFGRQATLPKLFDAKSDDKLPNMPTLNRTDTLPLYTSRPASPSGGQPPLPAFELDQLNQRPFPQRNVTGASTASYASNAPLMNNASDMGGRASPAPSLPPLNTNGYPNQPPRSMTSNTNRSNWGNDQPPRSMTSNTHRSNWSNESSGPGQQGGMPPRMASAIGDRGYTQSPVSYTDGRATPGSQSSVNTFGHPVPRAVNDLRSNTPMGPAPSMGRRTPFDPNTGRSSPAPSDFGRNSPANNGGYQSYNPDMSASAAPTSYPNAGRSSPAPSNNGGYQSLNPNIRSASAAPTSNPNGGPRPQRNMTDPSGYFGNTGPQRPDNAAVQINRLASPAPYNNGGSPGLGPMGLNNPGYRRS